MVRGRQVVSRNPVRIGRTKLSTDAGRDRIGLPGYQPGTAPNGSAVVTSPEQPVLARRSKCTSCLRTAALPCRWPPWGKRGFGVDLANCNSRIERCGVAGTRTPGSVAESWMGRAGPSIGVIAFPSPGGIAASRQEPCRRISMQAWRTTQQHNALTPSGTSRRLPTACAVANAQER